MEDVARCELQIERLRKKFIDYILNHTFCNKNGAALCKMNKIWTLYLTASTEIKESKLNGTFVASIPMTTGLMYGKTVFLITPEENDLDALTETKMNLSFFHRKYSTQF